MYVTILLHCICLLQIYSQHEDFFTFHTSYLWLQFHLKVSRTLIVYLPWNLYKCSHTFYVKTVTLWVWLSWLHFTFSCSNYVVNFNFCKPFDTQSDGGLNVTSQEKVKCCGQIIILPARVNFVMSLLRHLPSRFIIKFNLLLLIFLLSVISLIFYMIYYDMFRRSGTETYGWQVAGRSILPFLDPL